MVLLIKLYKDKASRIGIKYSSRYPAVKPLEDLITKYPKETFNVSIELRNNKIQLTLEPVNGGQKIYYRDLDFRKELLNQLNNMLQSGMLIEFVHVYMENNVPMVAKAFHKNCFIQLKRVELIGNY